MKYASSLVVLGLACLGNLSSASDMLTNHNDNMRSGLVTDEVVLTPANIAGLHILFQPGVDGQAYAQPLCVANQLVFSNGVSQGQHNLVLIATENDSVYAFDADNGTNYWKVSLIAPGDRAVHSSDVNDPDLKPLDGITATPAIDHSAGTNGQIFVVAMETDGLGNFDYKLHALDLASGKDALTSLVISGSVTGSGPATTFKAQHQRSRSALLLLNGVIYTAFGSIGDQPPYSGWLFGYHESDFSQVLVFNTNPNGSPSSVLLPDGSGGGIWEGGLGPATDTSGNLFFSTGNGPFDSTLINGASQTI